jgi:hypothetical protein
MFLAVKYLSNRAGQKGVQVEVQTDRIWMNIVDFAFIFILTQLKFD